MTALTASVLAAASAAGSRWTHSCVALVACALCTFLVPTLASAQTPIQYGDCVQDTIVFAGETIVYEFPGNSGDVINIGMRDASSSTAPRIALYDSIGSLIVDVFASDHVRIDTLTLNATGQYTIIASEQSGGIGMIYGLYLQRTNGPGQATAMSYGDCVQGTIPGYACGHVYTFDGTAGDVVNIGMRDASSSTAPRIELYDPSGSLIVDVFASDHVRIDTLTLNATGQYTIIASEHTGGIGMIYGLYLQRTNGPGQATAMSYGDCVQGTIPGYACGHVYTFDGTAGDVINIGMRDASSSTAPRIELYDPIGSLIVDVFASDHVRIDTLTLNATGQYTIIASEQSGGIGMIYGLYLQRTNGPGQATAMSYGDCVQGTIPGYACGHVYTFDGTAGDVVNIGMRDASSSTAPRIELYDPIGSLIVDVSASNHVRIDTLTLNATGQYTIIASEQSGGIGMIYGLYLQRTNGPGQATAMSYGDCVQGTIPGYACGHVYTFDGTAGDVVNIGMRDASSSTAPRIELYDPIGSLIVDVSASNHVRIDTLTLNATGQYTIIASEHTGAIGMIYGLYLQRTNGPGQATAMSYGDCVQGTIPGYACGHVYTFDGTAGDVINIEMRDASSSTAPRIELYDPSGSLIVDVFASNHAKTGALTLNVTGQYTIIASEHTGAIGMIYELCLNHQGGVDVAVLPLETRPYLSPVKVLPNPVSSTGNLRFALGTEMKVHASIFAVSGRKVWGLEKVMGPGVQTIKWDARRFDTGVYFLRVEAGPFVSGSRIVIVR